MATLEVDSPNEWVMVDDEDPCTTPIAVSRSTSVDATSPDQAKKKSKKKGKKKKNSSNAVPAENSTEPASGVSLGQPAVPQSKSNKERMRELKQAKAAQERLWEAASCGSLDGVQRAIEAGADVNMLDEREAGEHEHVPALVHASVGAHADVISLLLEAQADVEGANKHGVTALMEAATCELNRPSDKGKAKAAAALEMLVAGGANVNNVDCDGESALFKAAHEGAMQAVKILLNRGADPTLSDTRGRSPADMADKAGHAKIVMLLNIVSKQAQ